MFSYCNGSNWEINSAIIKDLTFQESEISFFTFQSNQLTDSVIDVVNFPKARWENNQWRNCKIDSITLRGAVAKNEVWTNLKFSADDIKGWLWDETLLAKDCTFKVGMGSGWDELSTRWKKKPKFVNCKLEQYQMDKIPAELISLIKF